ncbi:MAG: hypothetical protein FWD98_07510, partial [Defluviitaleaceae bacterium]|nr:hypothetical protein [Defluviitaleaceae bacterium]
MRISDTVGYLLNFAFPPRCISCAEVLAIDYAPPLCSDCTGGLCYAGSADVRDYSLYAYNSVTRRIIHACKYGG